MSNTLLGIKNYIEQTGFEGVETLLYVIVPTGILFIALFNKKLRRQLSGDIAESQGKKTIGAGGVRFETGLGCIIAFFVFAIPMLLLLLLAF